MPESRIGSVALFAGFAVVGLLILKLRRVSRKLKASQKEVQRLKNELRRSAQSLRHMEPPETIDMKLVEPKLYAALRRQNPELPLVHSPNRTESLWSHFDSAYRSAVDHDGGLADFFASIHMLVCKFCELNADDFKWQNDHDHKSDAASMQLFWHRVQMSMSAKTPQEARQAPMPEIRSGQLFCKVLEYDLLSRRSKILSEISASYGASPRVSVARGDGPPSIGGSTAWLATALQTSRLQLFKYTHSSTSPRRPANELNDSVSILTVINNYMLRPHSKAAIDLFAAGGYLLARALTRQIVDQPPEVLPEFLYKGLKLSPESLSTVKTDDFWGNTLKLQFQSSVFFIATSSLPAALAPSPGETASQICFNFLRSMAWCRRKRAFDRRHLGLSQRADFPG